MNQKFHKNQQSLLVGDKQAEMGQIIRTSKLYRLKYNVPQPLGADRINFGGFIG